MNKATIALLALLYFYPLFFLLFQQRASKAFTSSLHWCQCLAKTLATRGGTCWHEGNDSLLWIRLWTGTWHLVSTWEMERMCPILFWGTPSRLFGTMTCHSILICDPTTNILKTSSWTQKDITLLLMENCSTKTSSRAVITSAEWKQQAYL